MTHLLWKYYWEDDIEKFRAVLAPAAYSAHVTRSPVLSAYGGGGGVGGGNSGSPGAFGTSPRIAPGNKLRKASGLGVGFGNTKNATLGKNEVNSRDHAGTTVLLRAASSTSENAIAFVQALLDHPSVDIYAQDQESGWNALHRALYAGNASIARALLNKEREVLTSHAAVVNRVGQLIKTKDHEGNSPFELYNSTIGERALKVMEDLETAENGSESDQASEMHDEGAIGNTRNPRSLVDGDELFAFGSNKNISLGVGDQDDRQFPERIYLQRPDSLLQRFHGEYLEQAGPEQESSLDLSKIPALTRDKPLLIRDVTLAKLHSAVITADPVSNLYVCGIGRGGRLGLGDENTRFNYTPVQGGLVDKRVVQVALGQNHSMAITDTGELWTWGSNTYSQLGYALPEPIKKDEEPISVSPRQVFGPLKKEVILGIAASSIHSVAHTGSSLFCWGKNVGQLALMDADSRSLEVQQTPRKVAPSVISGETVVMVSAIDKATTVMLENHSVFVLTAYGYVKLNFMESSPVSSLGKFNMSSRYDPARHEIQYITSGGDRTIAAISSRGDLFTAALDHKLEATVAATSTTNPSKIKGAVTQPQCIWSAKKEGVRSVSVGENGSVIFSTESGAVWRRVKRLTARDAYATGSTEAKRKDFKFQRVPLITRVATVRASPFGAFAAIRKDSEVMKREISVGPQTLWDDVAAMSCLKGFKGSDAPLRMDIFKGRDLTSLESRLGSTAYELIKSADPENDLLQHITTWSYSNEPLNFYLCTTSFPALKIPVHGWLLAARSAVLKKALISFRELGSLELPETLKMTREDGRTTIRFQGIDVMTLLNLVHFMYEDRVIPVWNFTRGAPSLAYRYRQVRTELMKTALRLSMTSLEDAARLQVPPQKSMDTDFRDAIKSQGFFEDGDALLQLDGLEIPVHSSFMCRRCPWFEGLFHGRSEGMWLAGRRQTQKPTERTKIDLKELDAGAFNYVLQHLYGDFGTELFDTAVTDSFDDFIDLVMEVLGMADYLLLDRLSQICQSVLGQVVTTRNASQLLNEISPLSVSEFKDAGLEYTCLQLEHQLENHFLDDLDADLLLELDEVVRDNQAAQSPFARSGRTEMLLHEKYPHLAEETSEERQRRVREMAFKVTQREEERKVSSSFKGKYGSLDDFTSAAVSPDRARRVSRGGKNAPFSPELRPKESQADLMFAMDDDAVPVSSPLTKAQRQRDSTSVPEIDQLPSLSASWKGSTGRLTSDRTSKPLASPPPLSLVSRLGPMLSKGQSERASPNPSKEGKPWGQPATPASKTDLRNLLSESSTVSLLSAGIAAQNAKEVASKPAQQKMSQKERKKQQQAQAAAEAAEAAELAARAQQPKTAWEKSASDTQTPPWKLVASKEKTSFKDLLSNENKPTNPPVNKALIAAKVSPALAHRRTASPDTRFSGQQRPPTVAYQNPNRPPVKPSGQTSGGSLPRGIPHSGSGSSNIPMASSTSAVAKAIVPHSKSYLTPGPKNEPTLGFSLADIIGQQEREQQSVKDAVSKRSLQEIQAEQEFEEWWEEESRRTQEEESRRLARDKNRDRDEKEGGLKKNGRRGHGGKPKGATGAVSASDATGSNAQAATPKPRGYRGGKGRAGVSSATAAGGEAATKARVG